MRFNPQAKLLHHGFRVEEWLTTGRTSPVLAEVSPTGYCNAKCSWCFFADKHSGERVNTEVMIKAIKDMAACGLKAINWTGGGEPSIHPDFAKFVLTAHECGLEQGIFTNGYQDLPFQQFFSWIRIAVTDSNLEKVKKPIVPFGIVLNHLETHTGEELMEFCKKAKDMGACYFQVRPVLEGDYKKQPFIMPPDYLKVYQTEGFEVCVTDYKYQEATKAKTYKDCFGYHFTPSIDWKGHVSVCLYRTLEEAYILGDLNTKSFTEIWDEMPKVALANDECQNCCKNHEINKALDSAKRVEMGNFL